MSQSDDDDAFVQKLVENGLPTVVLNRQVLLDNVINVTADDAQGVRQSLTYAYEQGYRKFAMIEGKSGFRSTTSVKTASCPPFTLFTGTYSRMARCPAIIVSKVGKSAATLLQLPIPPEIIFCGNDDMAIGALNACHQLGISRCCKIIQFDCTGRHFLFYTPIHH